MDSKRVASHAGSWYTSSSSSLDQELSVWLQQARPNEPNCKALIGPHAGFSYSGPTAAWAYCHINPTQYTRVFLFGPSHHFYLTGCALPYSKTYATPIGDLDLDLDIIGRLEATGKFSKINKSQEEAEHSLEMHLPYIRKVFQNREIKLVPIMVGSLEGGEEEYGRIFAEYFNDRENLFIVSSDFCHWGQRFGFTPYERECGEIYQSIEAMDREGMRFIENQDLDGFKSYLNRTRNTICGRNPIILLLSTLICAGNPVRTKFVRYDQSEQVKKPGSSSVSYAAGVSSIIG